VIVVVGDLAVQAIEAFIHVDDAAGLDRTDRADGLAMVAASAHARVAVNPIAIARTRHHKVALIDFTAIFSCFPGSRKA
jgi:hypothetical protein